jgi:predicted permease
MSTRAGNMVSGTLETLLRDTQYALRLLKKSPGFTGVAVLTLGIGIGLNTTVFTAYDAVALRLLPIKDPGGVVRLTRWHQRGARSSDFTAGEFRFAGAHTDAFDGVAAASTPIRVPAQEHLGDNMELAQVQLVSGNYFQMLGVAPASGRAFLAEEDGALGAHPVAVISNRFWQRRFVKDPAALGKTFLLNGVAFTIVGIAPESFAGTGSPPVVPDFWIPLAMSAQTAPHEDVPVQLLCRLKPGITEAQVKSDLEALRAVVPQFEPGSTDAVLAITAKQATFFDTEGGGFETFVTVVKVLMFAAGSVLLIGCLNLINLLLARALARRGEIAVRYGLGASRARLVRQLCTESAVVGLLGGAAGLVFSMAICRLASTILESRLARFGVGAEYLFIDLRPDATVLLYAIAISVITGILIGIGPARHVLRADLASVIKQDAAATLGRRGWFRSGLTAMQVAVCLMLLVGAALLWQGVRASSQADPGFETKRVFAVFVPPESLGANNAEQNATRRKVVDRLRQVNHFRAVALSMNPPLLGHMTIHFELPESTAALPPERDTSLWNAVSPEYFQALGIPLVRGRAFTQQEADRHDRVVLVSEAGARRYWPGQDPLGKRVVTPKWMFDQVLAGQTFTVAGVVKDVRGTNLSKVDPSYFYFPASTDNSHLILVRSDASESATVPLLRDALLPVNRAAALQLMAISIENGPVLIQRLMTEAPALVAAVLGALGLLLATIGIYGVVSYLVGQRTREIGLRAALGATRADVMRLILVQTLVPVLYGVGFGLLGAAGLCILLWRMVVAPDLPDLLYGINAWNPGAFLAAPLFLVLIVLAATSGPVRRAMRVDPASALRYE